MPPPGGGLVFGKGTAIRTTLRGSSFLLCALRFPFYSVSCRRRDRSIDRLDKTMIGFEIAALVLSTKKEAWFRFVAYQIYAEPYQWVVPGSLVRWARA
jgi:hypothetical protein